MGLSFRVRNGTGRFPHAMTAVTLVPVTHPVGGGVGSLWLQHVRCTLVGAVVVLLFSCVPVTTVWFVVWEPHSGRKQSCFFLPPLGANPF